MTKQQFRRWQKRMGWSNNQAAAELRVTRSSVQCYRSGRMGVTPQTERLCELIEQVTPPQVAK